jgi:hypothetical protein
VCIYIFFLVCVCSYDESTSASSFIQGWLTLLSDHGISIINMMKQLRTPNTCASSVGETAINIATTAYNKLSDDTDTQTIIEKGKQFIDSKDNVANVLSKVTDKSSSEIRAQLDTPVGKEVFPKVVEEIKKIPNKLKPDEVVEKTKQLINEPYERQKLVNKIKDFMIDILMKTVPHMNIDNIDGEEENIKYSISGNNNKQLK